MGIAPPRTPLLAFESAAVILSRLKLAGFSDQIEPVRPRLILDVSGPEKSGKTHFAFTAPSPIVYFGVDIGTEHVIQRAKEANPKKIIICKEYTYTPDLVLTRNDKGYLNPEAVSNWVDDHWNQFAQDYRTALKANPRTIILDTASEFWEFLRLARFGKQAGVLQINYGLVNDEFRNLIKMAYASDTNLILLSKAKQPWVTGEDGKRYKTKEVERFGFGELGFLIQASLMMKAVWAQGSTPVTWSCMIRECRTNPDVSGMVLDSPDFQTIAGLIVPNDRVPDHMWEDSK